MTTSTCLTSSSEVLTADLGPGVWAAFTTRAGGRSSAPYDTFNLGAAVGDDPVAVEANRQLLSDRAGAPVVFLTQVHACDVVLDPRPGQPVGEESVADAVVLTDPCAAAAVLVADCLPVLLAGVNDRGVPGAVAAVHAGRRGVLAGIVGQAVARMRGAGFEVRRAAVGPAICGRCYEVPEQMQRECLDLLPSLAARTWQGSPALDLRAGVQTQLRAAGVTEVDDHAVCTREDPRFYSYRRDGQTGRFAGVVRLERHAEALGAGGP
ncbi:laccase domain-containing protein [Ruania alkalisoli]|uniref:Laccase domain-containing protein n=1 Tax=Ruania alkalisoli TaxID=2779775 RepID=A0A7M1SYV7_9MICO|nr:polyphenol oxidase family protein [Ruania alkalisoli]QOR72154.1 laccase domain-containing protein [Ruania alkalisoli]